jgi:hypothetical protein
MDLDAEVVLAIEQLDEDGEAGEVGRARAENLDPLVLPEGVDVLMGARRDAGARFDFAARLGAVDEFPAFADFFPSGSARPKSLVRFGRPRCVPGRWA